MHRSEGRLRMNNLLIIQARMGSSRLPDKVLKRICGKPMLQHILERILQSREVEHVIVATTMKDEDRQIEELCREVGIDCFRGSENDVLDRYYQAAKQYRPRNVIRITADCPLIDPELIDIIIKIHIEGNYDYTSNTLVETFPDGLDTEVFKFSALKEAWDKAELASEREHVTPYIKYKGTFKRFSVESDTDLSGQRWTVDTAADFQMIEKIYGALYIEKGVFLMKDVLEYLEENPWIETINAGIMRNEGYIKSLKNDYNVKGEN